jgi:hypothetical protein
MTDPLLPPRRQARLRGLYPTSSAWSTPSPTRFAPVDARRDLSPPELFRAFYRFRTGREMDDAMAGYMDGVFDEARGEAER